MPRIFSASVLFAILVLTGGVVFHSQNTPRYALTRIGKAIQTRDAMLLEKHVDLHAVIDAAVDRMLEERTRDSVDCHPADADRAELTSLVRRIVVSAFLAGTVPGGGAADIQEITQSGDRAHAKVRIDGVQPDSTLVLELELERRGSGWVLVEVVNAPECVGRVSRR